MYIAWEEFTENFSEVFKTTEQAVQNLIDSYGKGELDNIKILKVTNLAVEPGQFEITGVE